MKDKKLDHIIREKLERLDIPYEPSTWDALERRMDAAQVETEFDDNVRKKVQNWEATYKTGHWDLLEEKMDAAAAQRVLYRYKAAELALLLLFLFTLGQLLPNKLLSPTKPVASSEQFKNATNTNQNDISTTTSALEAIDRKNRTNEGTNNSIIKNSILSSPASNVEKNTTNEAVQKIERKSNNTFTTTNLSIPKTSKLSTKEVNIVAIGALEETKEEFGLALDSKEREELSSYPIPLESPLGLKPSIIALSPLSRLGLENLFAASKLDNEQKEKVELPAIDFVAPSKMRLSLVTAINADYMQIPTNESLALDAYNKLSAGYSSGLMVGWKENRTEVETGFIYSHKTEKSDFFIIHGDFFEGFEGEEVSSIEFDILELPIQIKYDLVQRGRWQLYPMFGASMHIVSKQAVEFSTVSEAELTEIVANNKGSSRDNKGYGSSTAAAPESSALAVSVKIDNDKKASIAFPDSYFTLNTGIGIEYKTSERWSLFVQPTFKYNLAHPDFGGIGPNNNVIHSSSLFLGVKVGI